MHGLQHAGMRTLLLAFCCLATLPAADVPRPEVPDTAYAVVSVSDLPGFIQLTRDQRPRGSHTVLLPLDRLAAVDLRHQPVGTTMRDVLVLTFAYAEPLVLTFAEGRSVSDTATVLTALRAAAR